ncbi:hypothetical protein ISN44_As09g016510 [Arabidopsis suecica]|uniref:Uncharacterized protein n=1 Tax=Arabidopsis suecica TaxID=45249 RepID=A0A8T2AIM5_ARASU|nr:hypothetical protein ISN44_As09g016510 [Arabidopsis suecica]
MRSIIFNITATNSHQPTKYQSGAIVLSAPATSVYKFLKCPIYIKSMYPPIHQIKADKDSIEALVQPLENADRIFQEIVSYQKQIEDLEYKLDFRGLTVKTMEEIQSELSSL